MKSIRLYVDQNSARRLSQCYLDLSMSINHIRFMVYLWKIIFWSKLAI